jgi:PKD repeat protein
VTLARSTLSFVVGALCALSVAACTSPPEESAPPEASSPPAQAAPDVAPSPAVLAPSELFVDPEAEPDEGAPPLSVQFSASVEDNQGPVDCEWDFGDGSPRKAGLRPTHVYSEVADYEVVARCKDSTGLEGEGETDVFVETDEGYSPPPTPARAAAP